LDKEKKIIYNKMNFSIIVAKTLNNIIGKNGEIPWHLPKDLKHFREITYSKERVNVVIMGRKTWDSLKKPLHGRIHIVLSNKPGFKIDPEAGFVVDSLDSAFKIIRKEVPNLGQIFIIGGGVLYAEAIKMKECERIYCTDILHYFIDNDEKETVYFPEIDPDEFVMTDTTGIIKENEISFRFNIYTKIAI
jgi:dihydrofolate reductase